MLPEPPPLRPGGIDSLCVGYYLDGLGIVWEQPEYEKQRLRQLSDAGSGYE